MHGLCARIVMHSDASSWSYQSIMLLVAGDLRALFRGPPPSFLFLPVFLLFFFQLRCLECCLGSSLGARYWWHRMNKTDILSTLMELHYLLFFMNFFFFFLVGFCWMSSTGSTFEWRQGDLSCSMSSLPTSLLHRAKPFVWCSIKMTLFLKPETRPL